ncbi:MAG TPA: hypothetical protein VMV71_02435 [Candidatus Paceibacterota bacterium]|nr:hypothetical protein [Candidatus Paceibacterota bacterium]
MKITEKRFAEILGEHGLHDSHIDSLLESAGSVNEELAANIARLIAPISKEVLPKN